MSVVAVLHPGRMGAAVGAVLVGAGSDVRWLPAGRGDGTRRRAEEAGLTAAPDLAGCDVVESGGASYVDGGIIGGPPREPGTRLYLSGSGAGAVADLFGGTVLDARVIEGDCAASALKMAYAAWTKISAALVLGIEGTARQHGVAEALHEEWELSGLDLADRLAAGERAALSKGWRWVDEMRQIAATFDAAGQPEAFGTAAAEVFDRYPRVED